MKATDKQRQAIAYLKSQLGFFESSNDITSPTHLCDIEESANAELDDLSDIERQKFIEVAEQMYWTIRAIQ